jgi:putative peptide zinc metalloprotease protein
VAFAIATWVYRFVIFLGIAVLVYTFFFKLLGILLMAIELWYFIFRPVWREMAEWRKRWADIGPVVRNRPAFYVGIVLAAILLLPLDFRVNTQGLLKPETSLKVIAFQPSQVVSLPPAIGTRVASGTQLMAMESPALEHKIRQAEVRLKALERQVQTAGFDPETRTQQAVLQERLIAASEELRGLRAERDRLRPVLAFNGKVVDIDPDLSAGVWVPRNAHLLTVANEDVWVVDTYVSEADLSRIDVGYWARFVPQGVSLPAVWGRVVSIDTDATRVMTDMALTSFAGGSILVREQNQKIVPDRAIYRVRIALSEKPGAENVGMVRGSVAILGYPTSLIGDVVRGVVNTLVREAGF